MLPERQQRLNKYLSTLSKIARIYKVAVVITNQVQSTPSDNSYSNPTDGSTGGNILSHASTHRIRLNRPFENVYAKIIKSPYQHSSLIDARFTITDKGIDDLEDELKMLFHRNQQTRSKRNTFN
jgi:DNA repair protein RadA